ncbi:DUF3566 domain-containing protein [Tersicoccus phoenicis]
MKTRGAGVREAATGRAPSRPDRAPSGRASSSRTATGTGGSGAVAADRPATSDRSTAGRPAGQTASGGRDAARPNPKLVRPPQKGKVRRARLLVSKVDPWSVLKMAFLLSVALGIVTVVASIVLWTVLDLTGIFARLNQMLGEVGGGGSTFDLRTYASLGQVASFATVVAVANIFLLTALSVLAAVLYNITSTLVGGIGVTLTDD